MRKEHVSGVKTVEKSLQIIEILLERGPLSQTEIESEFAMTTSTVYRHLSTLEKNGYIIRDRGKYRLSFKFLTIGGELRRNVTAYSQIKQKVDELAAESNERAQFIIREKDKRVYLYTEVGNNPVQTGAQTGKRGLLHSSAAGKSILAFLPKQTRESIIDSLEPKRGGPNSITDPEELREALADVREQGYALNLEETTKGVHAIGAPVLKEDRVIGALSVSGPATRLTVERMENETLDHLLAVTNELELYIEHGPAH